MNNHDILFLYDAKWTNPNGDPDEENRPRMDYESKRNIVTDVRLKRYLRDYFEMKGHALFVGKVDGKTVTATERIDALFKEYPDGKVDVNKLTPEHREWMLQQLTDVRFFGALMPIKSTEGKGSSIAYIGPVQFTWGYSLNPVTVEEAAITSHFGSEAGKGQGTMGRDYRVKYSFLAFQGMVSGLRAEKTALSEDDLPLLDEAMLQAIPLQATRSKVGQYPRLYLRVEYVDAFTYLGDLRDRVEKLGENLADITEVKLEIDKLVALLNNSTNKIKKLHVYQDDALSTLVGGQQQTLVQSLSSELLDKTVVLGN